jgi:hypothetical protein
MLRIIHFDKHCSCHPQGESVMVRRFLQPCIGQALGRELGFLVMISGQEEKRWIICNILHRSSSKAEVLHFVCLLVSLLACL